MADTNHPHHAPAGLGPVESDGIEYRGIVWFVVVMALTVIVSAGLMIGTFKWLEGQMKRTDAPRAPFAPAAGRMPPAPNLLYMSSGSPPLSEPGNLEQLHAREDSVLNGYTYDKTSGAARIPIERAKALLLQRGLPSRTSAQPQAPANTALAKGAPEQAALQKAESGKK